VTGGTERLDGFGAYGLRLSGVDEASGLLVPAEAGWPEFELVTRRGNPRRDEEYLDGERAELKLRTGGEILIDRVAGTITFVTPRELDVNEVIHPYLAPAAAALARWFGRESFHAGAFVANGATWAVIGQRGSGKSSTLGRLALQGVPVVCDDMLVLEAARPFAGPRSVDLRADGAEALGAGQALGVVGARERWRLELEPLGEIPPLRGWIHLEWGEAVGLKPLSGAEKLRRLTPERGLRVPLRDPAALLELAALPAWTFRRPQSWESLSDAVENLLDGLPG
jgi:hypothetical protein